MTSLKAQIKKFKLEGKCRVGPLKIDIENKKGSVRSGTDPNGRKWSVTMPFDYGYIVGTVGADGDEVDCFIGPFRDSDTVFIIHQTKVNSKAYDEDKVMLGFTNSKSAEKAYHSAFNGPDLLDSITKLSMTKFIKSLKKYRGKKISAEQFVVQMDYDTTPKTQNLTKQQRVIKRNVDQGVKNALREGDPKTPVQTALPPNNTML